MVCNSILPSSGLSNGAETDCGSRKFRIRWSMWVRKQEGIEDVRGLGRASRGWWSSLVCPTPSVTNPQWGLYTRMVVKFQTAGWIQHQHEERLGKAVRKTAELSIVSLCTMYLGRDQQNQIVLGLLVPNCTLSLLQLSQLWHKLLHFSCAWMRTCLLGFCKAS